MEPIVGCDVFVRQVPYGIGLRNPYSMQCAIDECGAPRILLAAVVGAPLLASIPIDGEVAHGGPAELDMDGLSRILFGHAAFQYLNAACELGLPDLVVLRRAGLPAVVGNATADARACAS